MTVKGRILTIPNVLTIARLIFLVPFVFITLDSPFAGAIIAAILGFTDFLDGWIARRFHQESELGRILDPISDRALFLVSFIVFMATGTIPIIYVAIIGLREFLIALGTIAVVVNKRVRLDVTQWGKRSAFAAMAATPSWVMVHETFGNVRFTWLLFAWICTIFAVPAGYYSLIEYLRDYRRA